MLHVTVPLQPVAFNVAFSPSQHTVLSVVTNGAVGNGSLIIVTDTDTGDVPHAVVHVAVYVPTPTSLVVPVPPTDHVTVPVQPVAVNMAFSVPHTVVLFAETTGGTGVVPGVTVIAFDAGLLPQLLIHTAV